MFKRYTITAKEPMKTPKNREPLAGIRTPLSTTTKQRSVLESNLKFYVTYSDTTALDSIRYLGQIALVTGRISYVLSKVTCLFRSHLTIEVYPIPSQRTYFKSLCTMRSTCYLLGIIIRPWRWSQYVPPKRRQCLNYAVSHPKTPLRTSDSTHAWPLFYRETSSERGSVPRS
jgi:hypothetical protein